MICRVYCNNYLLCEKSEIATSKMEQTTCVGDAVVKPWQFGGSILFAAIVRYLLNHTKKNPDSTARLVFVSHLIGLHFSKLLPTLATGMSIVTSAPLLKVSPKWREQDPPAELVNVVLLLLLSVG